MLNYYADNHFMKFLAANRSVFFYLLKFLTKYNHSDMHISHDFSVGQSRLLMYEQNVISEQLPTGVMTPNSTINTTPAAVPHSLAGDYLFETLHGYNVKLGDFLVNIGAIIMAVWIILLNCLLMHTLIKCRAQLEVTDIFIHSLALTDCLNGVLLFYNSLYNIINFQNKYECLTRFGLIHSTLMNSTGHISLLTINRYIKITKPLQYRQIFKKWRMIVLSGSVWLFSFTLGLSPLLGWSKEYEPTAMDNGYIVCRYFGIMRPGFITTNVSLYWIPLILMIVLYTHVCQIVCKHSREITTQLKSINKQLGPFTSRSSWRFTKTMFTIIGVYFFCWMPTGVYLIVEVSGTLQHVHCTTLGNILIYTTSLGFLNSLLNPIIYATKISCVKQRFRKVFCCKDYRRQSVFSSQRQSIISDNIYTVSQASSRRHSTDNILTTSQRSSINASTNHIEDTFIVQ